MVIHVESGASETPKSSNLRLSSVCLRDKKEGGKGICGMLGMSQCNIDDSEAAGTGSHLENLLSHGVSERVSAKGSFGIGRAFKLIEFQAPIRPAGSWHGLNSE